MVSPGLIFKTCHLLKSLAQIWQWSKKLRVGYIFLDIRKFTDYYCSNKVHMMAGRDVYACTYKLTGGIGRAEHFGSSCSSPIFFSRFTLLTWILFRCNFASHLSMKIAQVYFSSFIYLFDFILRWYYTYSCHSIWTNYLPYELFSGKGNNINLNNRFIAALKNWSWSCLFGR
jgi:hypothetical protein